MVGGSQQYSIAHKRMIKEQLVTRGITDPRVLETMKKIAREDFVDDALKSQAYIDAPLQIGEGQTISQPYIVALMTQALALKGTENVLEIGTGCGYQTAILATLCGKVYTVERFKSLAMGARERLLRLGLRNVVMRVGDGSYGWEGKTFDRIIATCSAPKIPEQYLMQLSLNGSLVIPVSGASEWDQTMWKVTRTEQGFQKENLGPCRFVKLIGEFGYKDV